MTQRTLDALAVPGGEIFDQQIQPALRPEDDGRFVAIDVETGSYEMDEDDSTPVTRLRSRNPAADIWLMRVGSPTINQIHRHSAGGFCFHNQMIQSTFCG